MNAPVGAALPAFPCGGCGARLEFAPGTTVLRCPYCGFEQQIAATDRVVGEHDYAELGRLPRKPVAALAPNQFACAKCGARTQSNDISLACQFCGAPLVADAGAQDQIVPEGVLPFAVDRGGVREALGKWAKSRWFAPNSLKKVTTAEQVAGTYLPHWTYDTNTVTQYTGQRGEYYYTTETYTVTVDGQQETRTRQVRHTRWYPAAGEVRRGFDDVLVPGTRHLPAEQLAKLEPWPLAQAQPYQPDYLVGYRTLRYDVEPEVGLQAAKAEMQPEIHNDCRRDIGGDEQRVLSTNTSYFDLYFKLLLLPVWIAAYLHAGKTYQIMVNARTGEVHGARPYSVAKIVAAAIAAIILIVGILIAVRMARS